ncbi:hypothetical protein AG1IA_10017 [Rhizoctonia solani AG-1 IA]|uniref:Uncharacterized protein n=1 Tax=Thanatephorus cucumeris (strain AG1-IA) TaxID=983506 RepID=L8WGP2_THACA|nr:hypothetical protein AG1IA_10017 [Rhizoctonia solani AG-1 IA]
MRITTGAADIYLPLMLILLPCIIVPVVIEPAFSLYAQHERIYYSNSPSTAFKVSYTWHKNNQSGVGANLALLIQGSEYRIYILLQGIFKALGDRSPPKLSRPLRRAT